MTLNAGMVVFVRNPMTGTRIDIAIVPLGLPEYDATIFVLWNAEMAAIVDLNKPRNHDNTKAIEILPIIFVNALGCLKDGIVKFRI